MRTHVAFAATAMLLLAVVGAAGPAFATDNDQAYEHGHDAEHDPDCRGEDGERQSAGTTVDPNPVDSLLGTDLFGADDKTPVELDITVGEDQFVTFCSGENWDGQDPNTKESDRNSEAGGESDEPAADPEEGSVYVNPLWDGDCSGWNSDHHADGGCEGGTQKPALTDPVHARVTADVPGASDPEAAASVYQNVEIWGVGRGSPAVTVDHAEREAGVAVYLEDHSDQSSEAVFGPDDEDQPLCDFGVSSDCFDGNYLLIPFDPIQGGQGGEGDCTSHEYQTANSGGQHGDHPHDCRRDNSALVTIQVGYEWLPAPDAPSAASNAPTLP